MSSVFPRTLDASFADNLGTEIVTILVGPDEKKYTIHKNLITSQSEYFDKALNGGFREAGENIIHLEEDDPSAIALLIAYLYRSVIPGPASKSIHSESAFPPSSVATILPQGGTKFNVVSYSEPDPSRTFGQPDTNVFHSILAHIRYSNYSSEELRLADYADGRKDVNSLDTIDDESQEDISEPTPLTRGGIFSNSNPNPFTNPRSSLFGFPATTSNVPTSGLFGTPWTTHNPTPSTGTLFGNPTPTTTSLFSQPQVQTSQGLFGPAQPTGTAQPRSIDPSGLFGASPIVSGGLFRSVGNEALRTFPNSTSTTGLFGATPHQSTQALTSSENEPNTSIDGQSSRVVDSSGVGAAGPSAQVDAGNPNQLTQDERPSTSSAPDNDNTESGLVEAVNSSLSLRDDQGTSDVSAASASSTAGTIVDPRIRWQPPNLGTPSTINNENSATRSLFSSIPNLLPTNLQPSSNTANGLPADGQAGPTSSAGAATTSSNGSQPLPSATSQVSGAPVSASTNLTNAPPLFSASPFHPFSTSSTLAFTPATNPFYTPQRDDFSFKRSQNTATFDPPINPFQNNVKSEFAHPTTPEHQTALLNLVLFAETTCWPVLYNTAIEAYTLGERTLSRPPPLEHITQIYERTHEESSLRTWAVDMLASFKGEVDMSGYMSLLVEYEGFLEGILRKLRESGKAATDQERGFDGAGGLRYKMMEHGKKEAFGKGKEKDKGLRF